MPTDTEFILAATESAEALAIRLKKVQTEKVVFAESCTAGLVAALLGQLPGISNWLCGSAVTYRESVKMEWLGVSQRTLSLQTAESLATTSEMATGVLRKTEEATFSAAVTGHLGPDAPSDRDGTVFVAVAKRMRDTVEIANTRTVQLESSTRVDRQHESAKSVLDLLLLELFSIP